MSTGDTPLKVIVVDDDELDRYVIDRSFKALGDEVELIEVSDSTQAVDAIQRHDPDVTLLDVQMPGMSGFDVLTAIAVARLEKPVLMLSSSTHNDDRVKALSLGANDYRVKPSTLDGYKELAKEVHALYLR